MYKTKSEFLTNLEKELAHFGVVDMSEIMADFEQHFTEGLAGGLTEAEICGELGDIAEIAKQYAEEEIFPAVAVENNVGADAHVNPQDPPPTYDDYVNSGIKINFFGRKNNTEQQNYAQNPPPPANQYANYNNAGADGTARGGTPPPPPPRYNDYDSSGVRVNWGRVSPSGLLTVLLIDIFVLSWAIPALFGIAVAFITAPFAILVSGIVTTIGGTIGTGFFGFVTPLPGISTFFLGLMLTSVGGLLTLLGVSFMKLFVKIIRAIINWHGTMIVGRPVFKQKEVAA